MCLVVPPSEVKAVAVPFHRPGNETRGGGPCLGFLGCEQQTPRVETWAQTWQRWAQRGRRRFASEEDYRGRCQGLWPWAGLLRPRACSVGLAAGLSPETSVSSCFGQSGVCADFKYLRFLCSCPSRMSFETPPNAPLAHRSARHLAVSWSPLRGPGP